MAYCKVQTSAFMALFSKDLGLLFGSARLVISSIGLAMLFVVVASFAFRNVGYGEAELRGITPGILWLVFLFTGVVALNHSFLPEREQGAMQGVLLTPVNAGSVYLSKFASAFLFVTFLEIFVLLLHGLFFWNGLFGLLGSFVVVAALFAVGFVALGTLLSAISVVVKEREIVLPLILFPLCIPLLLGCVELSRSLLASGAIPWGDFWLMVVVVFDAIALSVSWALFEPLMQG